MPLFVALGCAALRCAVDWLTGGTPCYSVYETRDGHISVGALEPKFWGAFCAALRLDHLVAAQFPDGPEEVARVRAEVQTVLLTRTSGEWKRFFDQRDCCVEIGRPQRTRGTGLDSAMDLLWDRDALVDEHA